jgi:hypothetical protein
MLCTGLPPGLATKRRLVTFSESVLHTSSQGECRRLLHNTVILGRQGYNSPLTP